LDRGNAKQNIIFVIEIVKKTLQLDTEKHDLTLYDALLVPFAFSLVLPFSSNENHLKYKPTGIGKKS